MGNCFFSKDSEETNSSRDLNAELQSIKTTKKQQKQQQQLRQQQEVLLTQKKNTTK